MRLIPFSVFLPTGVSLLILTLHLRLYKISGVLYEWSTTSRVPTQVVIHVLASALSALLVFPICTIVSQWTRHRLLEKSVSLVTLRVWTAVIQTRTDWNLPWTLKLTTLLFFAFIYLPAVLWAGSLTPVITLDEIRDISLSGKVTVSYSYPKHQDKAMCICQYNTFARSHLTQSLVPSGGPTGDYAHLLLNKCWESTQSNGTFTNCLKSTEANRLLQSVATSSPPDNRSRVHSKWDNTKFQYIGRSYGVGAAAALTDRHIAALQNIQQYTYAEIGFHAETKCIYNESSALTIRLKAISDDDAYPSRYLAYGALPNANWSHILEYGNYKEGELFQGMDFYAQVALSNESFDHNIVSTFIKQLRTSDTRWMFGMVTGQRYLQLNKTQCETTFRPSLFNIVVFLVNSTISVSQVDNVEVDDPDPTYNLREVASDSYGLSYVSTSLYTSTVGDAFMANIPSLKTRRSVTSDDVNDADYQAVVLDAIADSVMSVMDDSLVALGSASLVFPDATQVVSATAQTTAVQIGSKPFIWTVVVLNILGSLAVVASYFVLRKATIPTFQYSDIGCVSVGIDQGITVLEQVDDVQDDAVPRWDGDPGSHLIGRLAMRLQLKQRQ